jgi:hypothetical protein
MGKGSGEESGLGSWNHGGGTLCWRAFPLCAEHARQLEGESPFDNLMEVKS